jgi:cysteine desulfurase
MRTSQKQSFVNELSTYKQQKEIYLDNAATTKPCKEALFEANKFAQIFWHNPSSLYDKSKDIKDYIEQARSKIGYYIGAKSNEVYFTSGGSESNAWAIQGFIHNSILRGRKPIVITSIIEHKSILECICNLCVETHFIGVNSIGKVDLLQMKVLLERIKRDNPNGDILVSIQHANNEIGIMQPIKRIAEIVHSYGAVLHTDSTQVIGHLPVDVKDIDVDLLSASAHKFYGLKGCGFLYIKNSIKIEPLIYGSQNNNMRGGTENVIGIVAMEKALSVCDVSPNMIDAKFDMRDKIMAILKKLPYNIEFNNYVGYKDTLPTIISMTIRENITAEALVYMLNTANIYISAGAACNAHSNVPSHVLRAIGLTEEDSIRTVRISFDKHTTDKDIEIFVDELDKAIRVLKV